MATRSRTSFNKRQKELARLEKQRDKAARRVQRKLEKQQGVGQGPEIEGMESTLEPEESSEGEPHQEP
jgi:hypothetical protein